MNARCVLSGTLPTQAPSTGGGASASKLAGLPNYRFGGGTPGRKRVLAAAQVWLSRGFSMRHRV